ncbi:MAG: SRPBCC family protein [Hyphomicrobiales bacterium]|nr:Rieske 2Fe-2S domain-containing protein [Alphaproteobacteria bacterium]MDG1153043.1 SRPBCC family protein [Hyphomicrobiales bacterium]MBT4910903.1 Rieske 2Fe-2S domain-containing protein [Alphaproteobacteria bacterium]MBT5662830.1 Rieske 2Fe-2S domain-containing protein [Alphaproteobacteria bacterium]MDG1523916.1 SRPBCC family protein [Hyphomicrobiales bacterium]
MPQTFNYVDFSETLTSSLDKSASLSKDRYISEDFMQSEWEGIWTKAWLFAGLESDLLEPGDFFIYDIGRESIVITRNNENEISAFYNVCQHRGNKIVTLESGSFSKVSCPYHGWTYGLDGTLEHVPDRELFKEGVPCEEKSLKPVKVSVWAGLVFINMDENSSSLETFLGPIVDQLKPYKFEKMNLVKHQTVSLLETNWKTVRDNFLEQYHVDFIHPQHASFVDCCDAENDLWPFGHTRTMVTSPVVNPRYSTPDEPPEFMKDYLKGLRLNPDDFHGKVPEIRKAIQKQKRVIGDELGFDFSEFTDDQVSDVLQYDIFPNIFMTIHPERLWIFGPKPHHSDPNKCSFTKWSFQIPSHQVRDESKELELLPGSSFYEQTGSRPEHDIFTREDVVQGRKSLTVTIDQDIHYLNDMQAGMHSKGFDSATLSNDEERLQHFHDWVDNWISKDSLWSKIS